MYDSERADLSCDFAFFKVFCATTNLPIRYIYECQQLVQLLSKSAEMVQVKIERTAYTQKVGNFYHY